MKNDLTEILRLILVSLLLISIVGCGGAEERKAKYLEKGKDYLQDNNYDKARVEFKNVLQIDPKHAEAYYYIGLVEEKGDEIGKAIASYRKAIELKPNYLDPKIKLAKIYAVIGVEKYIDEARVLVEDVQRVDKDNIEIKLIDATIEYKFGDKDAAISELQKIVKSNPSLEDGVDILSAIYMIREEDEKAIQLLQKENIDTFDSPVFKDRLVQLLIKHKKYDQAEKEIKHLIESRDSKYQYQVMLSRLYDLTGQMDEAREVLLNAIADDDSDATRYLVYVDFVAQRDSAEQAMSELKRFINDKPDLHLLKFALSDFYQKMDEAAKAKEVLNSIIEENGYEKEGVDARIKLASILFEENNLGGAKELINAVLVDAPNNTDALYVNSRIALAEKNPTTAINGLRSILKFQPKNTDVSMRLSEAYLMNNEVGLAESTLRDAMKVNPKDYRSHLNYSFLLYKMGNIDKALDVVERALTHFQSNYYLLEQKLKLLAAKGEIGKVGELLDHLVEVAPDKYEVYVNRGKYYYSQKEYEKAIEEYKKALDRTLNKYKILQLITKTYIVSGQPSIAKQMLEKRIEKDPDDVNSLDLLGQFYLGSRDYVVARDYFNKAIGKADKWVVPYLNLASSYILENKMNEAIEVYGRGIQKLPDNLPLKLQLASAYEKSKQFDEAIKVYEDILKENENHAIASNNLASLLVDIVGDEKSISRAVALIKNIEGTNQPALQDTVAWVYAKSGAYQKAIDILQPLVEKSPNVGVFQYHLGFALMKAGDPVAAKKYLSAALESDQEFMGKSSISLMLQQG